MLLLTPASLPNWGDQTIGAHHVNGHTQTLSSNICMAQFQTLLPRNAHVCSLEMLSLQGFVLIKAYHMNMQESKHQERLLAKFIKICE